MVNMIRSTMVKDTGFFNTMTSYKIFDSFKRINNAEFYGTLTIVANNKVICNSTSIEEIENVIEYELSKHK